MSRTIVVTGAAGTLGRAVVKAVEARGWTAAGVDIAPQVEGGIGGVDLTDEGSVASAFARLGATHGKIHGLANIAGGFVWEKVVGGDADTFDRMYRMNLKTAALASRAATEHLTDDGAIVNVAAAAAAAVPVAEGMASYAASKAGVMALTESLAEELKARGIRVNAVLPTILDTEANRKDMPDADRSEWVQPADAANAIVWLLSEEAHSVNAAGLRLSFGRKDV